MGYEDGGLLTDAIRKSPNCVLLLDEISSSLDAETEEELYRRLFEAYPQKTMLFITHRTAVSGLCDEVVKLT